MSATMITVTGLVFALTIVALQIAAGQYSRRLLRNYMPDPGTQVVREARWAIDDLYPNRSGYLEPEQRSPTHRPRPQSGRPLRLPPGRPARALIRRPRARTWSSGWPDRSATTSLRARR
jgi:hypothetical protein